jgi:single-strand DNA-binding protein
MSDGLNKVMLLGGLGADPELRFTQGGQAVLHLRLATTESYLDKDKVRRERTDWHSVVVWGKRGEGLAKILAKGSSLFVEGSLRTSSYDNREGVKVYKTEVIASNVILAGGKGQSFQADDADGASDGGGGGGEARGRGGNSGGYSRGGNAGDGGGGYSRGTARNDHDAAPQEGRGGGGYGGGGGRAPAAAPDPGFGEGSGGFGDEDQDIPFVSCASSWMKP